LSGWNDKISGHISGGDKVAPTSSDKRLKTNQERNKRQLDEHYEISPESSDRRDPKEKQDNIIKEELEKENN